VFDILAIAVSVQQVDKVQHSAVLSLNQMNSSGRVVKGLTFGVTAGSNYLHTNQGYPVVSVAATTDVWLTVDAVSDNNSAITGALVGVLR
jgi:hypothetical protein